MIVGALTLFEDLDRAGLKSYRLVVPEDNEPQIMGRNGHFYSPFTVVYLPMIKPSQRIPLRYAVTTEISAR